MEKAFRAKLATTFNIPGIAEEGQPRDSETRGALFPWRLHEMLSPTGEGGVKQRHKDAIISWRPHGRAFRVHNKEAFAKTIMPKFFNQTKYKSFQRQLHLWGFKRIEHGDDVGAYFNKYFLRGHPEFCKYMSRHRPGNVSEDPSNGPHCLAGPGKQQVVQNCELLAATSTAVTTARTKNCFQRNSNNTTTKIQEGKPKQSPNPSSYENVLRRSPEQQQVARLDGFSVNPGVQTGSRLGTVMGSTNIGMFSMDKFQNSIQINSRLYSALSSLNQKRPSNVRGGVVSYIQALRDSSPQTARLGNSGRTVASVDSVAAATRMSLSPPSLASSPSGSRCSASEYSIGAVVPLLPSPPVINQQGQAMPFPWKLHEMLDDVDRNGLSHIVSWTPQGRALKVHDPQVFTTSIMPKYFRQTKFKSFQRQLNLWGFERVSNGPEKGSYFHPHFLRSNKEKCKLMNHVGVKGSVIRRPSPSQEQHHQSKTKIRAASSSGNAKGTATDSTVPRNVGGAKIMSTHCKTPEEFIAAIQDPRIQETVQTLHKLIQETAPELIPYTRVTRGTLGYGSFKYQYKTAGRQGEWCKLGISYGKQITLHCSGFINGKLVLHGIARHFPKAKVGLTSLRFQKLSDLDESALKDVIRRTASARGEETSLSSSTQEV